MRRKPLDPSIQYLYSSKAAAHNDCLFRALSVYPDIAPGDLRLILSAILQNKQTRVRNKYSLRQLVEEFTQLSVANYRWNLENFGMGCLIDIVLFTFGYRYYVNVYFRPHELGFLNSGTPIVAPIESDI